MSSELLAILVLVVVHLVAILVLLVMLAADGEGMRGWWPIDGSDDDGPPPDGGRPRGSGPPLADADQASLRLRGTGTLAGGRRPSRRRSLEPARPAPSRNDDVPAWRAGTS
jgi:hypothetical protein